MALLTWSDFNKNKNTINKEKTNSPKKKKTQKQSRARGVEQKEKEDSGGYMTLGVPYVRVTCPYPTSVRLSKPPK